MTKKPIRRGAISRMRLYPAAGGIVTAVELPGGTRLEGEPLECVQRTGNTHQVGIDGIYMVTDGYTTRPDWTFAEVTVSLNALASLVNHLRRRGWTCDQGPAAFAAKYAGGDPLRTTDFAQPQPQP